MKIYSVCDSEFCVGCRNCELLCPKQAITFSSHLKGYQAIINNEKCINCNLCRRVCPSISPNSFMTQIKVYQGWSKSIDRGKSSSGGAAFEIIKAFLNNGGHVFSCLNSDSNFVFAECKNSSSIINFVKSKYVKSDCSNVFKDIKNYLLNGRKVLFIGLPCQVASLLLFVPKELQKQLFTVDLICHGTPSNLLLKKYIKECNFAGKEVIFREKNVFSCNVNADYFKNGVADPYTIAFLNGLSYTDNCYNCKFSRLERVSDITLGDAWSSEIVEEKKQGISLILVQSEKGINLISELKDFELLYININNEIKINMQLTSPSKKTKKTEKFFAILNKGYSISKSVSVLAPFDYFKKRVKLILKKIGLIK